MASEWQRHDVADLISKGKLVIGDGYRAKNDELGNVGLPFARAGNINNGFQFIDADRFPLQNLARIGNKASQSGDVVFTSKGTVGRFAFVSSDIHQFVYSPQLCFWRSVDTDSINPRFLYYWMLGPEFYVQFKGVSGQTDMAEYVSLTDQRRMQITIPDIDEQRAIAHILGTLDDKIELNRRMNETLEAMARALFQSWFVDFDPVRAKAAVRREHPRWTDAAVCRAALPTLAPEIAALFPDSFENSTLGDIPKGWSVGSLSDVAFLNPESWSRTTKPEIIRYIDLANTKWGRIEVITVYAKEDAPSRAQRILRCGDTIVGTVRPGNGSYVLIAEDGLTGSTGFAVLRPRKSECREFIYLAATTQDTIESLAHLADGGAYPAVRPEVVIAKQLAMPPDAVIARFSKSTGHLISRWAEGERESRTLAALRDTLLPKLISGKLRIKTSQSEQSAPAEVCNG